MRVEAAGGQTVQGGGGGGARSGGAVVELGRIGLLEQEKLGHKWAPASAWLLRSWAVEPRRLGTAAPASAPAPVEIKSHEPTQLTGISGKKYEEAALRKWL